MFADAKCSRDWHVGVARSFTSTSSKSRARVGATPSSIYRQKLSLAASVVRSFSVPGCEIPDGHGILGLFVAPSTRVLCPHHHRQPHISLNISTTTPSRPFLHNSNMYTHKIGAFECLVPSLCTTAILCENQRGRRSQSSTMCAGSFRPNTEGKDMAEYLKSFRDYTTAYIHQIQLAIETKRTRNAGSEVELRITPTTTPCRASQSPLLLLLPSRLDYSYPQ